jgi:hypothetical protein
VPARGLRRCASSKRLWHSSPNFARAQQIIQDFARFWSRELQPAERRLLLAELLQTIWQKDGQTVALKPQRPLAPYFTAIRDVQEAQVKDPKYDPGSGSDGGETRDCHLTNRDPDVRTAARVPLLGRRGWPR